MKIFIIRRVLPAVVFCFIFSVSGFAADPVNGDFENNLTGWTNIYGTVTISGDAHSGLKACQVQISSGLNSAVFAVTAGESYQLTSYVKQTAGTGDYKVTLAWLNDSGAVIRYDNDWAGRNNPAVYTLHGGIFTAPVTAAKCVIILGTSGGVTCLFDDINLSLTTPPLPDESFLDNGQIRVGVSRKWGGSIDYLTKSSNPSRNYVNRYDAGRLIQRSYFGPPYSSSGVYPNWPWNPVQGGDGYENVTGIIELTNDGETIYTKCQPMDWSKDGVRTSAIFETWISLEGTAVRVEAKITFPDEDHALWRDQELLAVYVTTDLTNLKYYAGTAPFTNAAITTRLPGDTNEYYVPSEYWAAFVDDSNFGLGAFSQDAMYHTAFRIGTQGITDDYAGPTNYFAIIPRFSCPNNAVKREVAYIMLDTLDNMRAFVYDKAYYVSKVDWQFEETNNRQGWSGKNNIDDTTLGVDDGKWSFTTPGSDPYIVSPHFAVPADVYGKVEIRMSSTNANSSAQIFWSTLTDGILTFPSTRNKHFSIIPDGAMHTYTIDVSNHAYWMDTVNKLRLDLVSTGDGGTVSIDYIKIKRNVYGDLDNSGYIDANDVAIMAENWLETGFGMEADLYGDGIINFLDFSKLVNQW